MASPGQARPVRIIVIVLTGLLRQLKCRHHALRQPRVLFKQLILKSHYMHNGIETVFPEVADLLLLGIGKETTDLVRPSHHCLRRMGPHPGVDLPVFQHGADFLARRNEFDAHALLGFKRKRLLFGDDPVNLPPGDAIFRLQIALGENGERSLKGAESYFPPDQIRGRFYPRADVDPHLRQAEKSARKDRNSGERHPPAFRHEVRGERKLANIELSFLQHTLMPVHAVPQRVRLSYIEHGKLDVFSYYGTIEKRNVAVIMRKRHRQFEFFHLEPLAPLFYEVITEEAILPMITL